MSLCFKLLIRKLKTQLCKLLLRKTRNNKQQITTKVRKTNNIACSLGWPTLLVKNAQLFSSSSFPGPFRGCCSHMRSFWSFLADIKTKKPLNNENCEKISNLAVQEGVDGIAPLLIHDFVESIN